MSITNLEIPPIQLHIENLCNELWVQATKSNENTRQIGESICELERKLEAFIFQQLHELGIIE